jgi:hypothetical protein
VVLPIFLLQHGPNENGQVRFFQLDVAHGEHHYFFHSLGSDLQRMERDEQADDCFGDAGIDRAGAFDDGGGIWKLSEGVCGRVGGDETVKKCIIMHVWDGFLRKVHYSALFGDEKDKKDLNAEFAETQIRTQRKPRQDVPRKRCTARKRLNPGCLPQGYLHTIQTTAKSFISIYIAK